ncbi:MAG: Asp-tRNA(Asn)/Glu-tRNA(Gln) amidotransferase subunit GatA [Rhodobacteraceae bacterium]|nr:Asp-tRNA(Asn)/Glu-tRNA(Gln) amidotransferase subunit GatA [Paracoccaceae bacterium]
MPDALSAPPVAATPIDLAAKKALTFDVVGTLIDFESGIAAFIDAVAAEAGRPAPRREAILAAFGYAEGVQQRETPEIAFGPMLAPIYARMAGELGLPKDERLGARFMASIASWPAFPDSVEVLKRLKKRYRLVAATNADLTSLQAMAKTLKKPFDDHITADAVGINKPAPEFFAFLLERLSTEGIGPEATLHVAQSQFHDIGAAGAAGLDVAWIERRRGQVGSGATPAAALHPAALHFDRLWPLAARVEVAFGKKAPVEPNWAAAIENETVNDGTRNQDKTVSKGKGKAAKAAKSETTKSAAAKSAGKSTGKGGSKAPAKAVGAKVSAAKSGAAAPTDLNRLTLSEARDLLRAREVSSREITEACLKAIDAADRLNAVCAKTPEKALEMADAADKRLASEGAGAPSLCGAPLGIKDLFCTEGVASQAASNILTQFKPPYESTITAKLWDRGAVMLGKMNMDEFAMGSSNETSCYGPVVNPWKSKGGNTDLTPGGSSGGSASSVAADLCLGALGTDTGGSIRQPAAFTGIVGIKPTYGRCSRWGIVAFASSLDQAGPMTKSVRDAAILLEGMCGEDPKDSTSAELAVPDFEAVLEAGVKGKVIGAPDEYRLDGMPDEIGAIWEQGLAWMKEAGAEIREISLPHTKYALPAYYIIAPAEASSNLARYDGVKYGLRAPLAPGDGVTEMYEKTRAEGFGSEVKRRVLIGTYVLSAGYYDAYYLRAQKVRALIKRDFEKVFADGVDAILTPSTPSAAFGLNDPTMAEDPVKMYLNDVFTVTVNLAGLPGISVPAGLDPQGLPLGLQLIGKPWGEAELLSTAYALEQAAGFNAKPERWW